MLLNKKAMLDALCKPFIISNNTKVLIELSFTWSMAERLMHFRFWVNSLVILLYSTFLLYLKHGEYTLLTLNLMWCLIRLIYISLGGLHAERISVLSIARSLTWNRFKVQRGHCFTTREAKKHCETLNEAII